MIDSLILAFQFFTRIPINKEVDFNIDNLGRSVLFFPLTGIVIGIISGFVYYIFSYISKDIASFFALVSMIALTGGLHIDGLSDTFDGFFSYREKDRMMEIMKDSRIGAFGVLGIVLDLMAKFILINNIEKNIGLFLALSMANSRLIVSYIMCFKKSAKKEGLGYMFSQSKPYIYLAISGVIYLGIIVYIDILYLIPLLLNFILSLYITRITYKKIDGYTGDVYGMLIELGEIVSLLGFLGVLKCV